MRDAPSDTMRIDFVVTELFAGGAERCLTELALGVTSAGDEARVFSLAPFPVGDRAVLLGRLRDGGVECGSGGLRGLRTLPGCYSQLRQWLRAGRPDVCQTFLYHANVLGTWAADAEGIAVRVGGMRVAEARPLRCFVERRAIRRMTAAVCVSGGVRRFTREALAAPDSITRVIPNGVDVARFDRADRARWSALGWPLDAEVTIFVGRLHPQKGIDLLRRQIDRIAPPESRRKLLLVGDGPLRDGLERWIRRIGHDRVQMIGWQADIAPLLRGARLLALPSRYEGMPNVVLEAMASGLPVVCSRVEGISDLLGDDDRQTFATGDDVAMAERVERLYEDANLAAELGRRNRARAGESFSIESMVASYRRTYRELASL